MSPSRPTVLPAALLVIAACSPAADTPLRRDFTVDTAAVLLSTESEQLALPAQVLMGAAGEIYVLDAQLARVVVVAPDGTPRRTIGREGSGPGEIRQPRAMAVHGDTLRIIDQGNARVQLFDVGGDALGTAPLAEPAPGGPLSYRADGWLAVGVNGADSLLAKVFDETAALRTSFGRPIVPPTRVWNFTEIKNTIVSGGVPDILRNVARPVFGETGGYWLLFEADPLVHHYDASGVLDMDLTLGEPEFGAIREEFVERNRLEPNPSRFHSLSFFADGTEIDGRLWTLVDVAAEQPSVVMILDREGTVAHRITFTSVRGASAFAVDTAGGWIYFAVAADASLVKAPLPDETF